MSRRKIKIKMKTKKKGVIILDAIHGNEKIQGLAVPVRKKVIIPEKKYIHVSNIKAPNRIKMRSALSIQPTPLISTPSFSALERMYEIIMQRNAIRNAM